MKNILEIVSIGHFLFAALHMIFAVKLNDLWNIFLFFQLHNKHDNIFGITGAIGMDVNSQ